MSLLKDNRSAFCGAIIGRRRSGKTTLFVDLMRSIWKNRFAFVVWISPTVHLQTWIWDRLDSTGFITMQRIDQTFMIQLKEHMAEVKNTSKEILVVIDDIGMGARQEDAHFGDDAITQLAFAGRHYKISCLFLAQRFTQIPPNFRSQLDFFVFFGSTSNRELAIMHGEYAEKDLATFREEVNAQLLNDSHSAMIFMNKNGKKICTAIL